MQRKTKKTKNRFFRWLLTFVVSGLFFSAILIPLFYFFFESPNELILKRELNQYKSQIEIINNKLTLLNDVAKELQERDDDIYRIIFESEPIPTELRKGLFGKPTSYPDLNGYENKKAIVNIHHKIDQLSNKLYVQSRSFDEVFEMAKNKKKMLASIPAIQPINNKNLKRISSYYGLRTDPFYKVKKFHNGIDFSAPTGSPIYATGDGIVEKIIYSHRGYGNRLIINHGYNYKTIYAHLHKFNVKKGEHVKRGQTIAYVGNTGKSTAPHLHYEVVKNNRKLNPIYYFFNDISPIEFEMMIKASRIPSQSMD